MVEAPNGWLKKRASSLIVPHKKSFASTARACVEDYHLLQKYSTSKPLVPEYKGGMPMYKLHRVIEYITKRLHDVPLATLADIADMNVHHFAKAFKQTTELAPYQYIIQCRIERAKQLLANTSLPIIEVCHRAGFDNHSHFTKMFRRLTATTPKAYRNAL